MTRPPWDRYFLDIAKVVATRSSCTRRQVGAVLVDDEKRIISTGYNGSPPGEAHCIDGACPRGLLSYDQVKGGSDYSSGAGKCIALHAESNAINYAPSNFMYWENNTLYVTDEPCPYCATEIALYPSITRVVYDRKL